MTAAVAQLRSEDRVRSGNVLSITDARTGGGTMHKDGNLLLNLFGNTLYASGDDTEFELAPTTTVTLGTSFNS